MLPNLIVVGAMKCGTTSLYHYLNLHPDISMSRQKELDFFTDKKNWNRGLRWYESQFNGKAKIYGEASPNYTNSLYFPGVAEKMYSVVPEAKLIYVVRDPIERMIAHYIHMHSCGHEKKDINRALVKAKRNVYLVCSSYYMQLSYFLEYFDSGQILILTAEDLRSNPSSILKEVFTFLDVDVNFESKRFNNQYHKSARKRRKTELGDKISNLSFMRSLNKLPQRIRSPLEELVYFPFSKPIIRPTVNDDVRLYLEECLTEDIQKFKSIAAREFSSWSI